MQHFVVGKSSVGAEPHALTRQRIVCTSHGITIDIPLVDRSRSVVPLTELLLVRSHSCVKVGKRLRVWRVRNHVDLVLEAFLALLKRSVQVENRFAVLNGHHSARGETLAVANAVDFVDDGNPGCAGTEEVRVQRVHVTIRLVDRARRGNERLPCHLSAVDPLPVLHRGLATEDVDLDQFEIEERDEIIEGAWHAFNVASRNDENYGCSVERDDHVDAV